MRATQILIMEYVKDSLPENEINKLTKQFAEHGVALIAVRYVNEKMPPYLKAPIPVLWEDLALEKTAEVE